MKTIVFFALCALVSAEAVGNTGLADSPILQLIFDCRGRQDQKCLENILRTSNFYEAVEKACSNCSFQQKYMMVSWLDAYKKGMSIEKANKLFNPDNKYFDTAFVNHST